MTIRPAALCAALLAPFFAVHQAGATETVGCAATDGSDASIEMNVGLGVPMGRPDWVRVVADGGSWSTLESDGLTPISILQHLDDERGFSIDLTDDQVTEVLISLRTLTAKEDEQTLRVGYLHILGKSVHPVICDFGENE